MNLAEGQRAVEAAATELIRLNQRLLDIATSLASQPPTGHLRGIIHCVRDDLLEDAIDTLTAAAHKSEAEEGA